MEFVREYWLLILIAAAIVLVAAFLLLRPRQRVQLLQDSTPVRPHMQAPQRHSESHSFASEAAAAVGDVGGQIIGGERHDLHSTSGPPDDLTRLKGVGPKFAAMLNDQGISRFEQLARLSEADIERIDGNLGAFRGRIERDQIPLQADYLQRGDIDGFEQRFGKL
jgi:predicted flap endonuclease-1-like 5' DNA nuclease